MAKNKLDISDCYCEKVKRIKGGTTQGINCQCFIHGKPEHLKIIDLYKR